MTLRIACTEIGKMNYQRLLNDIDELEKNGIATRTYLAVGKLLQECGLCDRFGEEGCILVGREEYVRRLTTAGQEVCPRKERNNPKEG